MPDSVWLPIWLPSSAGVALPQQLVGVQDEEQEAWAGSEKAEFVGEQLAGGRHGLWFADDGDPKASRGEGVGHHVQRPVPEAHQGGLAAHGPLFGPACRSRNSWSCARPGAG